MSGEESDAKPNQRRMATTENPIALDSFKKIPTHGSDATVDLLGELGYRYIAINPGSSFRGLHDSIVNYHGNEDPKLLLCLHEEVAVSLAHGYAKVSGQPAAAAIHDLVGLMHASMAVYDAFLDQVPLVILGGSGPRDRFKRRPIDWIHSADTQAELIRSYVKWDDEPSPSSAFVFSLIKAHQIANSAPYGPTYVSLDCALQEEEVSLDSPEGLEISHYQPHPPIAPDLEAVRKAAEMLCNSRMPAIIGGRIGRNRQATDLLVELVDLLGAAYIDDRNTVAFPTDHPNNCNLDPSVMAEADTILSVDVVDLPSLMDRSMPHDGTSANDSRIIDLSMGDIGAKSWSNSSGMIKPRSIQLLCDPMQGLKELISAVRIMARGSEVAKRNQLIAERISAARVSREANIGAHWNDVPISQHRLVAELWQTVKDADCLLLLRNTRSWPEGIWKFTGAGQYFGDSGGGGVGYGPGAMVGGALAAMDQGKLGVGIIGDGDFLMASSALWTAVHYGIPMLMVINDNSSFYNDEPHQARVARHRGRPPENSWIGMRISDPQVDLAALAKSYGCWAAGPIDNPSDLADAIGSGLKQALRGNVAVVHVHTTR